MDAEREVTESPEMKIRMALYAFEQHRESCPNCTVCPGLDATVRGPLLVALQDLAAEGGRT